jgi:hypothetical protein
MKPKRAPRSRNPPTIPAAIPPTAAGATPPDLLVVVEVTVTVDVFV